MARYTPGTDTDRFFRTEKGTATAVINTYNVGGAEYKMLATTTTTVAEYRGLSRADALAMAESADYNYRDKHGVRFWSSATHSGASWMYVPDCEGVECVAQARRINEAGMWRVVVTYSSTTVTHSAWTEKETV